MNRPHQQTSAVSAAIAGAVDLSALKARADAAGTSQQPEGTSAGGGGGRFVLDVTEQSFQTEVVERSMQVPVVVDLWANWCGPCKQLSPVLERLARNGGGAWVLAKVDIDAHPRIAQLFGVQSIPTVIAVAGGQPVDAFAGVLPEPQVRQWITAILDALRDRLPGIKAAEQAAAGVAESTPEDPRFTAAEAARQAGDYATAETAYQQILDSEPGNDIARSALNQVRFLARATALDPSAVARADAAPDDVEAQLTAADAEVAHQKVEQAFQRLVEAVRRFGGADRERVRAHLVELFDLFPGDDPRVATARRALARALF